MIELLTQRVVPGVLRLILYITGGILLGWMLEALGIVRRMGIAATPILRRAGLPPVCATAFVTAFASPKAAGGMLSAAQASGEMSRRTLVLGAVANSFASALMHLRVSGPMLIATLGAAGVAYVGFTILNAGLVLLSVLLVGRLWPDRTPHTECCAAHRDAAPSTTVDWRIAWTRWRKLLPRVLLVAIPVYTLVAYLTETGAFTALGKQMPARIERILPPASLAVVAMQMTSTTRAAPVARDFLARGELSAGAVFFALLTGYVLSLPARVLRRNLPGALSVYRGRNGLWIILWSQGLRFLVALATVAAWIGLNL